MIRDDTLRGEQDCGSHALAAPVRYNGGLFLPNNGSLRTTVRSEQRSLFPDAGDAILSDSLGPVGSIGRAVAWAVAGADVGDPTLQTDHPQDAGEGAFQPAVDALWVASHRRIFEGRFVSDATIRVVAD